MRRQILFLGYPDFQMLDLSGPLTVFECAERLRPGSYEWQVVAAPAGPVRSSCGVPVVTGALPRVSPRDARTLFIPGGVGVNRQLENVRLLGWIRGMASVSERVAGVCSGSFLLAGAGLLDGRLATTHWQRSQEFRQRFPQVLLDADHLHVRDGPVWTSGGITSGIDLALAMIGTDLGDDLAREVARALVAYHHRPGGPSQFAALLDMFPRSGRFKALLEHVRGDLGARHAVSDLAERAHLGVRHFVRAFTAEVGVPPTKAVERLRVEAARVALDRGEPVAQVARRCGFGQAERMRRAFVRQLGAPPSALRRSGP